MLTVIFLLILAAFGTSVASLMGKCPAGVPCLLLALVELLGHLPLG